MFKNRKLEVRLTKDANQPIETEATKPVVDAELIDSAAKSVVMATAYIYAFHTLSKILIGRFS